MAEETKRKKPVMLTGRSRKYLEHQGYIVALVERSLDVPKFPGSTERFRNKFDAFGFADLAAVHPDKTGTLFIQVTDHAHRLDRLAKILALRTPKVILQANNRIELHTWKASRKQGRKLWCLRLQAAHLWIDGTKVEFEEPQEKWFLENMTEYEPEF